MLGPGICGYSSASMCSQKPEAAWPIVWRKPEQGLPSAPRGASKSHRVVKIRLETQGSTTIGHSGPHECEVPGSNISPCLHLLTLFPSNSSRGAHRSFHDPAQGRKLSSLFRFLSSRGAQRPSSLFQLKPTSWRRVAASSSSHQGNLLAIQALQPPNSDATSCRRTSKSNWAAKPNRTTKEGHTTSKIPSSLALCEGGRIFSPSPPLTFPAWLLCLVLSILVRLSPHRSTNWNYGFDQLVSQRNWHHLLDEKLGFGGTWLSCRDVCSWLHEGLLGEVACRVPSCTLRGGCWRHLPIRNRDYRLPADWIRRCSGLSENKGNGDSCQKPLKAAHDDWCAGQSSWHSERGP